MKYLLACIVLVAPAPASALTINQAIIQTCHQQGFKTGTPKFKTCRAKWMEKIANLDENPPALVHPAPPPPPIGDGTPDDRECQGYGFQPGAQGYLVCRFEMKRLHDDDQRVAAARSAMEATEAQMRALAAQEPPRPAEPSLMDRLGAANQAYWADRAKHEAEQKTTHCHTDYNGDMTCTTD